MKHLPTLQKAKELVTFEFYQTWVNKMQGNQEGDWITTHQMVKAYWFGGDTPKFSEWEKLTIGKQTEMWSFREDLSGISGEIKASTRILNSGVCCAISTMFLSLVPLSSSSSLQLNKIVGMAINNTAIVIFLK